jgi:prolyl 4-hydroxylase
MDENDGDAASLQPQPICRVGERPLKGSSMGIMDRAGELARTGRRGEALAIVEEAADQGDGEALLALANWRLFGIYGERDLSRAHELFSRSAEAGNIEAARTKAMLIANGTGCTSDPSRGQALLEPLRDKDSSAALQLSFLATMLPIESVPQLAVELLSTDPHVRLVRGLLLRSECDYVRTLATPALEPSYVIEPRTGRRAPHPFRTSMGMNFGPTQEDLVIHAINRRIAAATGTDVTCGELLHVLRYTPGQEYKPHMDALPGAGSQRVWTALVYLNDGYSGGETEFTELGISVRGEAGDALIFRNVGEDGRGDPRTRHAGRPVTSGEKWLATRWIRDAPCDPWAREQP